MGKITGGGGGYTKQEGEHVVSKEERKGRGEEKRGEGGREGWRGEGKGTYI